MENYYSCNGDNTIGQISLLCASAHRVYVDVAMCM